MMRLSLVLVFTAIASGRPNNGDFELKVLSVFDQKYTSNSNQNNFQKPQSSAPELFIVQTNSQSQIVSLKPQQLILYSPDSQNNRGNQQSEQVYKDQRINLQYANKPQTTRAPYVQPTVAQRPQTFVQSQKPVVAQAPQYSNTQTVTPIRNQQQNQYYLNNQQNPNQNQQQRPNTNQQYTSNQYKPPQNQQSFSSQQRPIQSHQSHGTQSPQRPAENQQFYNNQPIQNQQQVYSSPTQQQPPANQQQVNYYQNDNNRPDPSSNQKVPASNFVREPQRPTSVYNQFDRNKVTYNKDNQNSHGSHGTIQSVSDSLPDRIELSAHNIPDDEKIVPPNQPMNFEIVPPPTLSYDDNLSTTTRASILQLYSLRPKATTESPKRSQRRE